MQLSVKRERKVDHLQHPARPKSMERPSTIFCRRNIHTGDSMTLEHCRGCVINGNGCKVSGRRLKICGDHNMLNVRDSVVTGNRCRVVGNGNYVYGFDNLVSGCGNQVVGKRNLQIIAIPDPPISRALLAKRNLEPETPVTPYSSPVATYTITQKRFASPPPLQLPPIAR